jgi:hypothetical protein
MNGLGSINAGHEIVGYNSQDGCDDVTHPSSSYSSSTTLMSETSVIPTHPPAVKVGGRRLSASRPKHNPHNVKCILESPFSRLVSSVPWPRPSYREHLRSDSHLHSDQLHTEANFQVEADSGPVDYPRPDPPPGFVRRASLNIETTFDTTYESSETSNPFNHIHNQYEEESPKTEKKSHQQMMNDLEKLGRTPPNWESKRPTRDHVAQNNPRRIDQPAGKGL